MAIRKIVSVPFWDERPAAEGELVLRIHTGVKGAMAFGFGSHPTSSACLSIIAGLYAAGAPRPRRVLDVGCGTGVLGIAAARLGAEEVLGLDIDPHAVELAVRNAAANEAAERCRFSLTSVNDVPGSFDLVVANLPSREVVGSLADPLCARAQGGLLLVSGFVQPKSGPVLEALQSRGRVLRTTVEGRLGWCALLLR